MVDNTNILIDILHNMLHLIQQLLIISFHEEILHIAKIDRRDKSLRLQGIFQGIYSDGQTEITPCMIMDPLLPFHHLHFVYVCKVVFHFLLCQ